MIVPFVLVATSATGQDWPDLIGTWKGPPEPSFEAKAGISPMRKLTALSFVEVELTKEWTENKVGIISGNGVSFYTVDHDGLSNGRIIDADHFELCYLQTDHKDPQMVASCVTFERQ